MLMTTLEQYFDFLSLDDIRVNGTRIGIETILDDYLDGFSPEEIAIRYRSLTLEQVYATITYYLHERPRVESYLQMVHETGERAAVEQQSPEITRLREQKASYLADRQTA